MSSLNLNVEIIDVTKDTLNEKYLYRCLAPMPSRRISRRQEYLEAAIPRGFHKRLLLLNGEVVGQIEFGPPEASYYPIAGEGIVVMNCIWVLRKAKGHRLGTLLLDDALKSMEDAPGWATIGLEGHWSGWLRREHMELLGFRSIDSIGVVHSTKHRAEPFGIHLMWLPLRGDAKPPTWDRSKILRGVRSCIAHPLYHPEKIEMENILKMHDF